MNKDNRFCLICQPKNRTLYWHQDPETKAIWCYCNKCDRGYSLESYCYQADIDMLEFLKGDFYVQEAQPNEVSAQSWPARFIPLSDPRAEEGIAYIKEKRGLTLEGDMYYDIDRKGIVFPYYFGNHFVGAQTRFIEPRIQSDGTPHKIDTLPGTRLGLLFYGWNQSRFVGNVKAVVVCEGAFNALSINQALNLAYGGISNNPWRAIAASGSGASSHQREALKELKDEGMKIIIAPDHDEAGQKMLGKYIESEVPTHWALPDTEGKDWNDIAKELGREAFAKHFISCVKKL